MAAFNFNSLPQNNNAAAATRQKAEFWLNFGYVSPVADSNGEYRFVSTPLGIALDTQEHLPTNTRNAEFNEFQQARNEFLDQLVAWARANLKPGEGQVVTTGDNGMAVQIRRVNDEAAPMATGGNNRFAMPFSI